METSTREIDALRAFLEAENEAQHLVREAYYDLSVEERVESGHAIGGARFVRREGDSEECVYLFECARNRSRFRPGTRLRISRRDPRRPAGRLELIEDRYDGKKYLLRLTGKIEDADALEGPEPWVLDEDVFDLLDTQLGVLDSVQESELPAWLAGEEESGEPQPLETHSRFEEGLTGTMLTGFRLAVAAQPYFSIQGPPGSGKTHLLGRLALYYALEENKRVLITAVSHQAIHYALGETHWVGRRMAQGHPRAAELLSDGFYKLGASRGANEGLPGGVRAALRVSHRKRPLVAGATLYAALHPAWGFSRRPFDVILFDEAGQAPLVLALAARLLARKVIYIGDDAQLPPVVSLPQDAEVDPIARMSVLEFIRRRYSPPFLLTETRRLNRELCRVISDCFYGGELAPTSEAESRRIEFRRKPEGAFARVLDPEHSLVFVDVPHQARRSDSEEEACWAAALALEAVRCGIPPQEVGVVAPYRAQTNRIRFLLGKKSGVLCSTVERFQGQERELIVISLTSSQRSYLSRLAGFLFSPNRLNVAISRARTKVVLLGSRKALLEAADEGADAGPDGASTAGFGVFKKVLAAAHLVDGSSIPEPPAVGEGSRAAKTAGRERRKGSRVPAFEAGSVVEHPQYGAGRVLSRSVELIDNKRQWINEIRFNDGKVRLIVPALSDPPMRKISE